MGYKKSIFRRFKKLYKTAIPHAQAETLRKRLLKHKDEILTFLKYPEIEPTNNRAERALRNLVILRKIIFGNRSEQGKKNVSLIAAIIRTAKSPLPTRPYLTGRPSLLRLRSPHRARSSVPTSSLA